MQVVIDIPEDIGYHNTMTIEEIIMNGIVLPKGHGRLIDADAVLEEPIGDTYRDIDIAETIIEADNTEEGN